MPQISIPLLAVAAEHDPITLPQASDEIASATPHGRYQVLTPAKHYGLLEHDEAFAELAAEFCYQSLSEHGDSSVKAAS